MSSFTNTKVLSIGGSRNIGYHTAVRILAKGGTVTFLLRNPTCFDADATIQGYVQSGHARLIKADALVKDDVKRAWAEAAKGKGEQKVDIVIFTVGTIPKFSLTKGLYQMPANLVTQSLLNTLTTIPDQTTPPKIITISSTGLTKSSHASLPLLLKPLYGAFLAAPHQDKIGMEKVVSHCAGWTWDPRNADAGADMMGADWVDGEGVEGLPRGTFQDIMVVRPALLTDGDCKAETTKIGTKVYKIQGPDLGGYVVSRKDVAHFLVEGVLGDWAKYKGKCVSIAY